jgi:hypothetical protein
MVMPITGRQKHPPDNEATIDHLDSRLSPERGMYPGLVRHVLACRVCNGRRAAEEERRLSSEELWRRSGSYPREFGIPDRRDVV